MVPLLGQQSQCLALAKVLPECSVDWVQIFLDRSMQQKKDQHFWLAFAASRAAAISLSSTVQARCPSFFIILDTALLELVLVVCGL